jgi:hypothetical protein
MWAIGAAGLLAASAATVRFLNADAQQISGLFQPAAEVSAPIVEPHRMIGWRAVHPEGK